MARKREELAAAKAKKQKIILIVGGVLLLAVAAFQVPKLLGGGSGAEAVPAVTTGSEDLVVTAGVIGPGSHGHSARAQTIGAAGR